MLVQQQGFDCTLGEKLSANHRDQGAVPCRRRQAVGQVGMFFAESLPGQFLRFFAGQVADRFDPGHLPLIDGTVQQGVEMIHPLRRADDRLEGVRPLLCQREQDCRIVTSAVGVVHDYDARRRGQIVEAVLGHRQTFGQRTTTCV